MKVHRRKEHMAFADMPACLYCRIAAPCCSLIASKVLKQRPATVKRAADVCLDFVELEQAEAVEVGVTWAWPGIRPFHCPASLD